MPLFEYFNIGNKYYFWNEKCDFIQKNEISKEFNYIFINNDKFELNYTTDS